jgi:integrase
MFHQLNFLNESAPQAQDPPDLWTAQVEAEAIDTLGPLTYFRSEEHTPDHKACPACRSANVALQAEKINISVLPFGEAVKFWKLLRAQDTGLKKRTHETTDDYLNALGKFFDKLCLRQITPGHIRSYQIARQANLIRVDGEEISPWKRKAANMRINHEICALGQILTHCRLWQHIKPFYFPLPVKSWSPRQILSEEDEERFFKIAARHPEAELAYWVAAITNNTTAAGCELRGLRFRNIFLRPDGEISEIYIPEDAVKNDSRPRMIALNSVAKWAVEQCYKRALKAGSCEPQHFLFPFRHRNHTWAPERAPSRWFLRCSWNQLRKATKTPHLKPHDLRHHCITRLLENGVDPETVRAIAGHVDQKMVEYYAHQRKRVKYAAVVAIEPKKKAPASELEERRRRSSA